MYWASQGGFPLCSQIFTIYCTHYTVTLPVIRVSTAVHIQTSDKCLRSLEVRQASVEGGDPLLHLLTLWELDF